MQTMEMRDIVNFYEIHKALYIIPEKLSALGIEMHNKMQKLIT